jgi:heat shock protein HtpX
MNKSPSILTRAILAVVLMVGFYVLALGIAAALLYIPYAEWAYAHRLHLKLGLACVIGAGVILWSILPRVDRFVAPGPRLTPADSPRLFAELTDVARAVGQAMPAEVYLEPDVNAWVAQRGGVMGLGSRRVMALGLPLMRVLTVSQLRAVLAHEFGHFYGGDTKLGPWIYKTRGAIVRTVTFLADERGQGSVLQLPFLWYGKMFLRITHAVSRRQEFVADDLAARTVGARPLVEGLRVVHGFGPAFQPFWFQEVMPVLNAGFRPPLAEGFAQFVQAKGVSETIAEHLQEEIKTGKADPYDTHPSLKDRIAAVAHLPPGTPRPNDAAAAVTLLDDVPGLEQQLLAGMAGAQNAEQLKPLRWEDVGLQVCLPGWTRLVKPNQQALAGLSPEALRAHDFAAGGLGGRLVDPDGAPVPEENRAGLAISTVGAALALALAQQGWALESLPGLPITARRGAESVEPFTLIGALASGKLTPEAWQRQCAEIGLAGVALDAVAGATV